MMAAAAALAVAAGLTACTSAASSTLRPSVAAADTVWLNGAGSTFDAPFFNLTFSRYQQAHPGAAVSYAAGRQQRRQHPVHRRAGELRHTWITVVHRSDGSGTTYIFSNYPSEVSPAWASSAGTGRSWSAVQGLAFGA